MKPVHYAIACDAWCGDTCLAPRFRETCQSGRPKSGIWSRGLVGLAEEDLAVTDLKDLCPTNTQACFVGGRPEEPKYECVDTLNDIENCGGCAISDPLTLSNTGASSGNSTTVRDCTLIPNASAVRCSVGKCTISRCDPGFSPVSGPEGDSCVRSNSEALRIQKYRLD